MLNTKQIQQRFYSSLLNRQDNGIMAQICGNQVTAEFRFDIYRNTVRQNLCHALEITFPAIWKLVGKECADSLAYAFVQDKMNLPTTNCLDDWGVKFPDFLQDFPAIAHLVYLKDIAKIEWLKHLSYCAADYRVLNPAKLQKHLDTELQNLRLIFNPSVFFYTSSYFLENIFELIENPDKVEKVDLQSLPSYSVIARKKHQVMTFWVSQELFNFLQLIKEQTTLMSAYEHTLETHPNFDLITVLQFMLKNELLWKCAQC